MHHAACPPPCKRAACVSALPPSLHHEYLTDVHQHWTHRQHNQHSTRAVPLPQASTPISLKATAGLRLLPGDKAQKILDAVEALLKKQPFRMAAGAVGIMGGEAEPCLRQSG